MVTQVHTFSFFDVADGFLAVSDGTGGMWTRVQGGVWREGRNGDDGIFFLTEPETAPLSPNFSLIALHFNGTWVNFGLDPFTING